MIFLAGFSREHRHHKLDPPLLFKGESEFYLPPSERGQIIKRWWKYGIGVGLFIRGLIVFQAKFSKAIIFTFTIEILLPLGCIIYFNINLFFVTILIFFPTYFLQFYRRTSFEVKKVSYQSDGITKQRKVSGLSLPNTFLTR